MPFGGVIDDRNFVPSWRLTFLLFSHHSSDAYEGNSIQTSILIDIFSVFPPLRKVVNLSAGPTGDSNNAAVRDEERASKRGAAPQMSPMRPPRRTTAADPQYLVGGVYIKRARVD